MKLCNTAEYFYESVFIFSSLVFAYTVAMVILHLLCYLKRKNLLYLLPNQSLILPDVCKRGVYSCSTFLSEIVCYLVTK